MKRSLLRLVAAVLLAAGAPLSAAGDVWEALHLEMRDALAALSREYFGSEVRAGPASGAEVNRNAPWPRLILVGFSGGVERNTSKSSGVVVLNTSLNASVGNAGDVRILTFNNFRWRLAATEVMRLVRPPAAPEDPLPAYRQPLIVVYGHSWGGGSIVKFAEALGREGVEVSLAVFIDTFQFRNPRLPDNIRYAVNFYQRAGLLHGLPLRGKSKLIARDPRRTQVLGNYRIRPETAGTESGRWNPLQRLLYQHHHRIAHDVRLQQYLLGIVNLNLNLLRRHQVPPQASRSAGLFDRVVILGASVSAGEKAPSPGLLLARHMGTPEDRIHTFAEGGAASDLHLGFLDNVAALHPSLILALDLFFHDFKFSLFLSESTKDYLRDYVARLHDSGAIVVLGNIPSLVILRHAHVNQFLSSLEAEFPRLVLLDVRSLIAEARQEGIVVPDGASSRVLHTQDLFADRLHPNLLGNTLMANLILEHLRSRFPERLAGAAPLPLPLPAEESEPAAATP